MKINFLLFNILWFAVAWTAPFVWSWILLTANLFLFIFRLKSTRRKGFLLGLIILGCGFDFTMQRSGLVQFAATPFFGWPLWLFSLWALFGWILPNFAQAFVARPWLLALLGSVSGPLSYRYGFHLQLIEISSPSFYFIYALFWFFFMALAQRLLKPEI